MPSQRRTQKPKKRARHRPFGTITRVKVRGVFAPAVEVFGVPFNEFAIGPDAHQSIAVYPARNRGPLFAFLHGGGWDRGYKETMGFMAPCFTQAGITFASIGYHDRQSNILSRPNVYRHTAGTVGIRGIRAGQVPGGGLCGSIWDAPRHPKNGSRYGPCAVQIHDA